MRIVTPPEHAVVARPGARVEMFGPPPGTTGIGNADMLVGSTEHGPVLYGYALPDPDEVAALLRGGVIELGMWGDHLHPWSVGVWTSPPGDATPPRDNAEDGAARAAADACATFKEEPLTEGESALCAVSARIGFRAGTRWVADGGLAGTVDGLLEALGWARPEAVGPAALRGLRDLAGIVGWGGPIPHAGEDPVPPYVLMLVRALVTGGPLDFAGAAVPDAVQQVLGEALTGRRAAGVDERWVVRYDDGSETEGWTEEEARQAVADRAPRYGAETTYAAEAVRQWRYAPSEWADGAPPSQPDAISQDDARWAVDLARQATDGYANVVAAVEKVHDLLDEFPDAVPTMRLRMLFATMRGHEPARLPGLAAQEPDAGPPDEVTVDPSLVASDPFLGRQKPPRGSARRTHTTTSVYSGAPCGHLVPVPNEAYERPVNEEGPHDANDGDADVNLCDRRFVVQVVDGAATFTEHASRWAWAAAAGASVATDCPDGCPACELVNKKAGSTT